MKLPEDMIGEIERLGEHRKLIERIADDNGLEFTRGFLQGITDSAALFEVWFPQLQEFVEHARQSNPIPAESDLTPIDLAYRRILQPRIASAERVPQRNNFTAAIFTAPLAVLPIVMSEWPSTYRNSVFLTPDELSEWHMIYDRPWYDWELPWWYVFQHWEIQSNPSLDAPWHKIATKGVAEHATPLLVKWEICWGPLFGGNEAELWCVDADGCETHVDDLWDETH